MNDPQAVRAPDSARAGILANENPGWNGSLGLPFVVTFSFAESPDDGTLVLDFGTGRPVAIFQPMTPAQRDAGRLAMSAWSAVSGVGFLEVPDRPGGNGIDIRLGIGEPPNPTLSHPFGGAALLPVAPYANGESLVPGTRGFVDLLAEVGEALGLKRPQDDPFGLGTRLAPEYDDWTNTVLSFNAVGSAPLGPQPLDVAAVTAIYGTAAAEPSWVTTARHDARLDKVSITGGGGPDAIGVGAYGAVVSGGPGDDAITGGGGADRLSGGPGDDTIRGNGGDDRLAGGDGRNTVIGDPGYDTLIMETGFRRADLDLDAPFTTPSFGGQIFPGSGTVTGGGETTAFVTMETVALLDGRVAFGRGDPAVEVYRLYPTVLGRAADPVGLSDWVDRVEDGLPRTGVAAGLLNSAEYAARYGATGNAGLITRAFEAALGRTPSPREVDVYLDAFARGLSREQFVVDIAARDPDFRFPPPSAGAALRLPDTGLFVADDDALDLARLYRTVIDRAPDERGLAANLAALDVGFTPRAVAAAFVVSPEFRTAYGTLDDAALVTRLYDNAFGRAPDAGGLANWTNALAAGTLTRADVALGISDSLELRIATAAWAEGGIVFA